MHPAPLPISPAGCRGSSWDRGRVSLCVPTPLCFQQQPQSPGGGCRAQVTYWPRPGSCWCPRALPGMALLQHKWYLGEFSPCCTKDCERVGSLLSQLWHSKGRAGKEGPAPRLSPSSGDALGAPSSAPATPGEPPPLLSSLAEMWRGKQAEKSGQLETPRHLLLPTSSPCCPSGREPPSHQGPRGCRR